MEGRPPRRPGSLRVRVARCFSPRFSIQLGHRAPLFFEFASIRVDSRAKPVVVEIAAERILNPWVKTKRTSSRARIYRPTARNIAFLARRLRAGELVAVPTETVYGLAANAFDRRACARIFRAKGRPADDPLIVHIHALPQLAALCEPNPAASRLAKEFWPGPLTLVLPKKAVVPDIVTAGRDSVAVRMPSHAVFRRLLIATGLPLAAPSANPFGYISPTTAEHVRDGLGGAIDFILEGGPTRIGLESTIVDLRTPERPAILRPGAITAAEISRVLRRRNVPFRRNHGIPRELGAGLVAPGLMARHYSPRTPLQLHRTLRLPATSEAGTAYLLLRKPSGAPPDNIFWLDPNGDLRGVARRLFAKLRELDEMNFDRIHVELARGGGLAEAINDRLRRAAAR